MKRLQTPKLLALTLLILFTLTDLHAAAAKRGWTKLELSYADGKSAPIPSALLERFGAERIADYGAYTIVYAPKGVVTALEAQAKTESIRVRVRDELDVLQLPGAALDAREGITGAPANKLAREYPAGKPGVFVIQFVAPLRAEWMDGLRALGWRPSRYIPNNGYLLVGTPELAGRTRQLAFVQWLDVFHPYQKAAFLARDGQSHEQLFELAEGDGSESAIAAIRAAAEGEIEVQKNAYDTRVIAKMSAAAAEELLRHEMVLSVSPRPIGELSDERQVMSLTSNLAFDLLTGALFPTSPTQYWNWVTTRCPECATMSPSDWKIAIADSGLDNGNNTIGIGHKDLEGRKSFGGTFYDFAHDAKCTEGTNGILCDAEGHGTFVSGIAAGQGAAIPGGAGFGFRDQQGSGFYMGQGVAPTAGIFMSKILSIRPGGGIKADRLLQFANDAAVAGATVQNHSWNQYSTSNAGEYSTLSRDFDIATRDAHSGPERRQMLFTVSSGNTYTQGNDPQRAHLALAGATAKNVLAVGGLENYRPNATQCFSEAEDFRNISRVSRLGTQIGGYYKPDLMAPASQIVSGHTSVYWPTPSAHCLGAFETKHQYTGTSGTSWAAPVGAGAAILVKRYLGTTAASLSPAATKAVLIAGARTIRGGKDRTKPAGTLVAALPNIQQGFGRLSLEDIFDTNAKPLVIDQSTDRLLKAPGNSYTKVVRVRDAFKPVKIALVWTDPPATTFTAPWVNDLHLEVRRSSNVNVTYVGNSLSVQAQDRDEESIAWPTWVSLPYDGRNNVEFFRLFVNPGEDLTITVRAGAINGSIDEVAGFEQDFALAIINAGEPCDPVTIAQQPQDQHIVPGQTATVSVVAGGTGPFNYQWYEGESGTFGSPVCVNTPNCTVGPLTATKKYWVQIQGACNGSQANSQAATVNVNCTAAPTITSQPPSPTINPGQSTTLSVTATQAVSYQWYQGVAPSTATPVGGNSHLLTVSPGSTTNYWVRVTNACGFANSVTATVCVMPAITAQPTSRTITQGQSTTFTVTAVNAVTYQWYQGTAPSTATPVGTNSNSYTVTPGATTSYWVRVTNSCGFVNSVTATVTVNPPAPLNITRLRSAFALANSQTSITATWPQPTQAGNFLVAVISGRKDPNGAVVWTAPAGWQHAVTNEWTNIKAAIYYIPNNAGSRTSETFTVAQGFHDMTLYLFEYSGIAAVNPLDKIATAGDDTNDGNVWTGFTANTVQAKELVITALTTYTPTELTVHPLSATELYDKFIGNRLTTAAYERINTQIQSCGHNAEVYAPAQWIGMVATFKGAN